MAGETGPITVSLPRAMIIAGFFAISIYNSVEILLMILNTFKRREGLYFWSMLVATLGIPLHTVSVLLRYFRLAPNLPMCVLTVCGWWAMVTGQSVVLYSRLHLVVNEKRRIRWVLIMIITSVCVLHLPVTVLFLGSNTGGETPFIRPFEIYENIQLAGFFLQELIISSLYIFEAARALRPILAIKSCSEQKVVRNLILANVLVVILDITLLVTQYTNNFDIQTTYKPVVYSVKLKIEFIVLNQLVSILKDGNDSRGSSRSRGVRECSNLQVFSEKLEHASRIGTNRSRNGTLP